MRRVLFVFLDGVGFGEDNPAVNPLVAGRYPTLERLTGGKKLIASFGRYATALADIVPLDAVMGVEGRPQSATGQASLLTGVNVPQAIGEHYGPRPDDRIRSLVKASNLFVDVQAMGQSATFVNAYPSGFFASVERGKRLLSAIQFAAVSSGLRLHTLTDIVEGRALSADYNNIGLRKHFGFDDIPVYSAEEAGRQLWRIAQPHAFTLHDHWISDEIGHHQDLERAVKNFSVIDGVLGGLLEQADLSNTLIVVVSDHGNVEDCSHGKHTLNPALCLLIGNRDGLPLDNLQSLHDIKSIVLQFLGSNTV